ncbi:MAG: MiaB/RimO family radical SAM methylthiotransferase, partial [Coriobacteriales bacterium]
LKVAFRTLGCKVNQVEAETVAAPLRGGGAARVPEEDADVVVVTTCSVTSEADHKARKAVRHALGLPRGPLVVVTGCLAALDAASLTSLGERVVVEADKSAVAARVREVAGVPPCDESRITATRVGEGFHTRAMVKVEDGCDNYCAYCIVPYARGVPRAVPLRSAVSEVEALVAAGVREVVLTGINIGRYADAGAGLPELITAVAATGITRIRLSSIEPEHVDEALLRVMASTPSVCEHLHVPLQSGSDRTLRAMGRHYDTAAYEALLAHARAAVPGLAVSTDVIVGFPGETEQDHAATIAFMERAGFSKVHVFRYSRRTGTPAARRPDQLDPRIIAARAVAVRECGDRMRRAHLASQVGRRLEVLVERPGEGTARDGSRVRFPVGLGHPGDLVTVTADAVDEHGFALVAW